jgi:hypothetical protein
MDNDRKIKELAPNSPDELRVLAVEADAHGLRVGEA